MLPFGNEHIPLLRPLLRPVPATQPPLRLVPFDPGLGAGGTADSFGGRQGLGDRGAGLRAGGAGPGV